MRPGAATLSKTALFIGLIILTIISSLPYVGTVLFLLTALIGAGAIVLGIHNCRRSDQPGSVTSAPNQTER